MKLTKLYVNWVGPYSGELFIRMHEAPPNFQHTVIGKGKSKQQATAAVLSELRHLDVRPILNDITDEVQCQLPPHAEVIEGDEHCDVYCVLSINVER
jgi:hypothetical protein